MANAESTPGSVVIRTGACKPFSIQVMVYSPEAGYRFEVTVKKGCTADNVAYWELVFDLFKQRVGADGFDNIVHVRLTSGSPAETSGLQSMVSEGISQAQSDAMSGVYTATKPLEGVATPTPEQHAAVQAALSAAATADSN